ncbi:Protein lethal(2)denticleless [Eumeta japonica]|uniref:Protein lethal(2)denticleless n=1 Tax=Eumeta variegata TaxID=151549 RepID=A0A4C1WBN0_EUMVA|nr:Protein lethal(2)denticleless [Eumeta japonica]
MVSDYRFNYDNILKRLIVQSAESFHGLQYSSLSPSLEPDPPIFACRFAESTGYEHILALADENGWVAIQDEANTVASLLALLNARPIRGIGSRKDGRSKGRRRLPSLKGVVTGRDSSLRTPVRASGPLFKNTFKPSNTQLVSKFLCHNNAVFDLAWMPGGMNFVTASGDHTANLWDVQEGDPRRLLVFSNHTKSVKTAVFRPTEPSVFATGARDGHILVWDIRANNQPSVVLKPDNSLMNCHSCFTPKTPGSHTKRSRIDNHRATSITGLVFQDDMTLVSCGECDGNIKVWDLRKKLQYLQTRAFTKACYTILW